MATMVSPRLNSRSELLYSGQDRTGASPHEQVVDLERRKDNFQPSFLRPTITILSGLGEVRKFRSHARADAGMFRFAGPPP